MTGRRAVALGLAGLVASCNSSPTNRLGIPDGAQDAGAGGRGGGDAAACVVAAQCPSGFTCEQGRCVPPEVEQDRGVADAPPVATPHYVYALNPSASSVARIDPVSLQIEAISVGPNPVDLAALPNEDAALALSYDDPSVAVIDSRTVPSRVTRVALPRQYGLLTVSPDGRYAVAWADPKVPPASGAEGLFALIDVTALRAGAATAQVVRERAGGFRITDVVFRTEQGRSTRVYVFAKTTLSIVELPLTAALPSRLALPAHLAADVASREVVASADGATVMIRSTVAPQLVAFDGTALSSVSLPDVATDLDLFPDGTAAVAALRGTSQLAIIEVPSDLTDPSGIATFAVADGGVGQVALPPSQTPPGGLFAFVWSNAGTDEALTRVELPSGRVTRFPLEKLIDEVAVSPDSRSALIIHRADPQSTASDPYEAAVDRDQGFSVLDVATGFAQLQRTGTTLPTRYAFSPRGGYAGVALRDDAARRFQLQAVNLGSLVTTTLSLASTPLFMGTVPEAPGVTPHRVFVSQRHAAGRISVIQLDSGQVRTATGFTLNGEIE